MNTKEFLNQFSKINLGTLIVLVSIILSIVISIQGLYWLTCGSHAINYLEFGGIAIGTILLYQFLQDKFGSKKWILVVIGCAINILEGLMAYSVIC